MVAIIALLLVGGVFVLSDSVRGAFTGGAECVASPGDCEGGSGGGGSGGGGPPPPPRPGRRRPPPRRPPSPEGGRLLPAQAAQAGGGHLLEGLQLGGQDLGAPLGQPVAGGGRRQAGPRSAPDAGAGPGRRTACPARGPPRRTAGCPWSWRSRAWARRPGSTSPATTGPRTPRGRRGQHTPCTPPPGDASPSFRSPPT